MAVSPSTTTERRLESRDIGWLLFLVGLALCLRLWQLGTQSIWVDEGATVDFATAPAHLFWGQILLIEPNPPGYYAFMRFWVNAFGITDWVLRLPSALASSIAILPMYLFALRHWGRGLALVASLLLVFSAIQIQYAQEARAYAFITLFFLTGLLTADSIVRCIYQNRPMGMALTGFVLSVAGLAYTHFTGLFIIAAIFIYQIVVIGTKGYIDRNAIVGLSKQTALIVTITLPVLLLAFYQLSQPSTGVDWLSRLGLWDSLNVFIRVWGYDRIQGPFGLLVKTMSAGLILAGLYKAWKEQHAPTLGLAAVIIFTVTSLYLMNFVQPILVTRVVVFGIPAILILMVYGCSSIPMRTGKLGLFVILLAVSGYDAGAFLHMNALHSWKEPWREMVQAVAKRYEPATAIVHIGGTSERHFLGGGPIMIKKYWPGEIPHEQFFASDGGSPLDQFMIEAHKGTQQLWPETTCIALADYQRLEILSRRERAQALVQLQNELLVQGAELIDKRRFEGLINETWTAPKCAGP